MCSNVWFAIRGKGCNWKSREQPIIQGNSQRVWPWQNNTRPRPDAHFLESGHRASAKQHFLRYHTTCTVFLVVNSWAAGSTSKARRKLHSEQNEALHSKELDDFVLLAWVATLGSLVPGTAPSVQLEVFWDSTTHHCTCSAICFAVDGDNGDDNVSSE